MNIITFLAKWSLVLLLMFSDTTMSADYEITKVIEVGPCTGEPSLTPLRWSPDGKYVAYFLNGTLMLSDSLGNSSAITKLDYSPRMFEWLSNNELIINIFKRLSESVVDYKLIQVDVITKEVLTLRTYERKRGPRMTDQEESFDGPWLTAEGHLYVRTNVIRSTNKPAGKGYLNERVAFFESKYSDAEVENLERNDNIVFWEHDGIYLSKADFGQVKMLGSREKHPIKMPIIINSDLTYYMVHWLICRISDSSCTNILIHIKKHPVEKFLAGPIYYSFNPKMPEVLIGFVYALDEFNEIWRMGTFNYNDLSFTMLDDEINMFGCRAPAYSPDGLKIAFISPNNSLCILYRKMKL